MYKVKGGEAFHMIALKALVCGIVYLFEIGLNRNAAFLVSRTMAAWAW